jgi:hypothetical protein
LTTCALMACQRSLNQCRTKLTVFHKLLIRQVRQQKVQGIYQRRLEATYLVDEIEQLGHFKTLAGPT